MSAGYIFMVLLGLAEVRSERAEAVQVALLRFSPEFVFSINLVLFLNFPSGCAFFYIETTSRLFGPRNQTHDQI